MARVDQLPFSGDGFDRAAHRRTDEQWLAQAWQRARVLLLTPESGTLIGPDKQPQYAAARDVPDDAPRRFLGEIGGIAYFTTTVPADERDWRAPREVGLALDELNGALLVTAVALEQWHQRHGRCAVCGNATVESLAGWTRTCPHDNSTHFPRTDPAVIMLVVDDRGRALLGRGTGWAPGRFSTLAGFVEPGETLENAVAREVFEEAGVRVTDVTYVDNQPWPFPSSLMVGFTARLDGSPELTLDTSEVVDADWFTRDEVRAAIAGTDGRIKGIPPQLSISRYLIDGWLDAGS